MSPASMLSFAVLSPVFGSAHSRLSNERDEPLFPRFGAKPLAAARRKAETLMSSRRIQEWLMRSSFRLPPATSAPSPAWFRQLREEPGELERMHEQLVDMMLWFADERVILFVLEPCARGVAVTTLS